MCGRHRELSGTGWATFHEVADYLVDVTDRHPDAVTALDGLGRFLAIVKNTITTCRKFDSPRGQHPYEESRGGRLLASSERERAVLAAEPRRPDPVRCGRRNEDTGFKALRRSSPTPVEIGTRETPMGTARPDPEVRRGRPRGCPKPPRDLRSSGASCPAVSNETERGATGPPAWG
jgi:hypothetical protein